MKERCRAIHTVNAIEGGQKNWEKEETGGGVCSRGLGNRTTEKEKHMDCEWTSLFLCRSIEEEIPNDQTPETGGGQGEKSGRGELTGLWVKMA